MLVTAGPDLLSGGGIRFRTVSLRSSPGTAANCPEWGGNEPGERKHPRRHRYVAEKLVTLMQAVPVPI